MNYYKDSEYMHSITVGVDMGAHQSVKYGSNMQGEKGQRSCLLTTRFDDINRALPELKEEMPKIIELAMTMKEAAQQIAVLKFDNMQAEIKYNGNGNSPVVPKTQAKSATEKQLNWIDDLLAGNDKNRIKTKQMAIVEQRGKRWDEFRQEQGEGCQLNNLTSLQAHKLIDILKAVE